MSLACDGIVDIKSRDDTTVATVTVRNLPAEVHRALRLRAAAHGVSTKAEVRAILAQAVLSDRGLRPGTERACAELAGSTTTSGSPIGLANGLIAAIAHVRSFAVASRETAPFRATGVDVIDPWYAA
jgi:plasmid stability protein